MSQTLVAIFDNQTTANRAVEQLVADGFPRSSIDVKVADAGTAATTTRTTTAVPEDEGVFESIGRFFSDLFSSDTDGEYASHYSEAVRRGNSVLTLRVDDESKIDDAHTVLLDCGAVDVDESVSAWRSAGYQPATAGLAGTATSTAAAATTTATRPATTGSMAASGTMTSGTATSGRDQVLPVIQEELEVGKRRIEQGRVRVVSHVDSKPVHETVQLQSEKAVIERHAVDRPVSEADLANLQDRTIEVRESAEKAVVNKTARVVEEVVVGKQVETETKQIDDTVRRTDVSVERDTTTGGAAKPVVPPVRK